MVAVGIQSVGTLRGGTHENLSRDFKMFITFEGVEGSGKTLQARILYETLLGEEREVILLRDPGGTSISEQIREVVLSLKNTEMAKQTEVLLYLAARSQLVAEKIKPAMAKGKIVICARFSDSTHAYQVFGRGFDLNLIRKFNEFADQGLKPDLTFFLDMPVETGLERRLKDKKLDRLDRESPSFHKKARQGYKKMIKEEPGRWVVIDGRLAAKEITRRIIKEVHRRLNQT